MQSYTTANRLAMVLMVALSVLVFCCSGSSHGLPSQQRSDDDPSGTFAAISLEKHSRTSAWMWFKSLLDLSGSKQGSRPVYQFDQSESKVKGLKVRRRRQVLGTSFGVPSRECGFVPFNNETFVESVYQFFSGESSTNILEYDVTLVSAGERVDLVQASSPDVYKPFRWYRTQGEGSSDLLQVNHYYFGLISPFMDLGLSKARVVLNVTSPACLQGLPRGEIESLLTAYFLTDFGINPKAVEHPYVKDDVVQVCHMTIRDDDGWGKLNYRCCGFESDILHCSDVHEDEWVWVLRGFIMALTILLFLYFPVILPRGYRIYDYAYYPPDGLQFNLRVTANPDQYRNLPSTQILQPKQFTRMTNFRSSLTQIQKDVTYTARVRRLDISVCADRLLQEDFPVISLTRSLFDTFVRCKIRHADPLEDCCKTNACGQYCLPGKPPWQAWMRAVRTILVMAVLALPALPFMYAQAAEGLEYQELGDAIEDRGLQRPFNFYIDSVFSKVTVSVLAGMYVIHTIVVIIDGATDGNIGRLYSDVLDVSEKKGTIRRRMENTQSFVKRAFLPVQRCGVLLIPVWILALAAIPIYLVIDFFLRAPMIKVFVEGFRRLLRYSRLFRRKPVDELNTVCGLVEIYLFFLTIVFVFIVLGIGANFLVHVVAMVIVKVLVDAKLVYRVLPVVLLLLLYIRDSFSRVAQRYSAFLAQVMTSMRARESDDLRRESFKTWDQQMNKIFKIIPEKIEDDPDDEVVRNKSEGAKEDKLEEKKKGKNLFLLKNGGVRMRLGQLLLFLNKDDFLFTSKKFLFSCCTMDCVGAPGFLEDNYIRAVIDFLKIGVFLIFMFLVVMAYGNAYYISPTNQMFVTLVSGLVPLLLRNVFLKRSAVETVKVDFRFESRLEEKIGAFSQTWEVHDIALRDVLVAGTRAENNGKSSSQPQEDNSPGTVTGGDGEASATKPGSVEKVQPTSGHGGDIAHAHDNDIHLVLDVSEDPECLESPLAVQQPPLEEDPFSRPECDSKQNGCCSWRSRLDRAFSCSCFKGKNSVSAEADDKKRWHAGNADRRRSSVNFFWDAESDNKGSPNSRNTTINNNSNGENGNVFMRNGNRFSTRDPDPEREGHHYGELWHPDDGHGNGGYTGRNMGRWVRQSEERRLALMRAREAEESARAAHLVSGIDALLISNAILATSGATEAAAGRGSLENASRADTENPDSAHA